MRDVIRTSLLLIVFLTLSAAAKANPAGAVEAYHDRLLAVFSSPASSSDQTRFDGLSPIMDDAFDFEGMIKTATGSYWRGATPEAKAALLEAFRRINIATYIDRFADLKSGKFKTNGTREGPRGLKLVDTKLMTGTDNVVLTYVTRQKDDKWLIIDVLLDGGISELALRTSEYASTLKNGGVTALTQTLNNQAKALLEK
ncbi:MAG: ABC transporter substrate-binding protein [Rhodospirillales bacterium]